MIDMCCPCSIQGDQSTTVHSPAKDVFWDEFALIPHEELVDLPIDSMLSLANAMKPVPVRVVPML